MCVWISVALWVRELQSVFALLREACFVQVQEVAVKLGGEKIDFTEKITLYIQQYMIIAWRGDVVVLFS